MPGNWREKLNHLAELPAIKFVGGITGRETVEANGIREEVRLFNSDNILGMKLFNGKILMNEKLFQENAENARKHTVLHEEGHRRQTVLGHLTGIAQLILSPPGLILGFLASGILALKSPGYLPALLTIYLTSTIVSYIGELNANLFALRKMGEESFLASFEESREIFGEKSPLKKVFTYPSHPPKLLTIWIFETFFSEGRNRKEERS